MDVILLAGIEALPKILLYVLIFVLFLAILYWILNGVEPTAPYARRIVLIVGALGLLYFLISLAGGGSSWRL